MPKKTPKFTRECKPIYRSDWVDKNSCFKEVVDDRSPGSDFARLQGCLCDPELNRDGYGSIHGKGIFVYCTECEFHKLNKED